MGGHLDLMKAPELSGWHLRKSNQLLPHREAVMLEVWLEMALHFVSLLGLCVVKLR